MAAPSGWKATVDPRFPVFGDAKRRRWRREGTELVCRWVGSTHGVWVLELRGAHLHTFALLADAKEFGDQLVAKGVA